jgi:hypothetical protein
MDEDVSATYFSQEHRLSRIIEGSLIRARNATAPEQQASQNEVLQRIYATIPQPAEQAEVNASGSRNNKHEKR